MKKPGSQSPQTFPVKIGACLSYPTKTFHRHLRELTKQCNRAKNAAFRYWQRWREDHPDWSPEQRSDKDGNLLFHKDGKPLLGSPVASNELVREMNGAARTAAPGLYSQTACACVRSVLAHLGARTSWRHWGDADFNWQAILTNETNRLNFGSDEIPINSQRMFACYAGMGKMPRSKDGSRRTPVGQKVFLAGSSSCVAMLPIMSPQFGVSLTSPIVRLEARQLSKGNRAILKRILRPASEGGIGFGDSSIHYHERKKSWMLNLTYKAPIEDHNLDKSRVAVLTPTPPAASRPFELKFPEQNSWHGIGDGIPYVADYKRLTVRRKQLQFMHRSKLSAGGHGRGRFYQRTRPHSRKSRAVEARFIKLAVSDVIKQCIKHNCGTLIYREPTLPLRKHLWIEHRGAPFNWTTFSATLYHKLAHNSIAVPDERDRKQIRYSEHKQEYEFLWSKKTDKNSSEKKEQNGKPALRPKKPALRSKKKALQNQNGNDARRKSSKKKHGSRNSRTKSNARGAENTSP